MRETLRGPEEIREKTVLSKALQDYLNYVQGLESSGTAYSCEFSGSIHKVFTDFGKREFYLRENNFKHEMNIIKKVKKYVLDNEIQKNFPIITEANIKYFDINKSFLKKQVSHPLEIDLSAAYWEAARQLQIISEEIYQEGLAISKPTRLIALGSLAKQTSEYSWEDGEYSPIRPKDEPLTRHLFFHVSQKIDKVMLGCRKTLKSDFMFFWTDAVFFQQEKYIPKLLSIIGDAGYASKMVENDHVRFRHNDVLVYSPEKGKPSKKYPHLKVRTFNYEA